MATSVIIDDVPAYDYYEGCGPTAAAMIIGYWDMNGYDNLFDASGWDEVSETENVADEISSPEHYSGNYDAADTSIADFFRTSEDGLQPGWSYLNYSDNAFEEYAAYRGYEFDADDTSYYSFSWDEFVTEIDADNPMMFLVDTNGDASTDHFVPVIGYEDRGEDGLWYAAYSTWSESEADIYWQEYQAMGLGNDWGVGYITSVKPVSAPDSDSSSSQEDPSGTETEDPATPAPTPEPATVMLLGLGLGGLALLRKRS
ncbi:hypothetical protein DENIS_4735 [Desulfonema ishimotonii]|uniref:PEP-CTERM protein-sorting domain-containing protein n=1 Tax=Desulfonema ishimotonii TaxID=45657 RepID=A0A401G3B7_9BACT|nr:C39 family peptidase [Desulfonema ishimotonii]GBC63737.1 hypothetical protein DENIS_4735 [Desulfonema ishimotonii]